MMKKYEILTDVEHKYELDGKTLYQIRALRDFSNVKKGDLGGFIEKEYNLSHDGCCWIDGEDAVVFENAQVKEDATINGNATVRGSAIVTDKSYIGGTSRITGNAFIHDESIIRGCAYIGNNVIIGGKSVINDGYIIEGRIPCQGHIESYYDYMNINNFSHTGSIITIYKNRNNNFYVVKTDPIDNDIEFFGSIEEFKLYAKQIKFDRNDVKYVLSLVRNRLKKLSKL